MKKLINRFPFAWGLLIVLGYLSVLHAGRLLERYYWQREMNGVTSQLQLITNHLKEHPCYTESVEALGCIESIERSGQHLTETENKSISMFINEQVNNPTRYSVSE